MPAVFTPDSIKPKAMYSFEYIAFGSFAILKEIPARRVYMFGTHFSPHFVLL